MDCSTKTAQESLQNPFTKLSEDSVTEILSRTSPLDASRFAVVSKGSKSAADSDNVWDSFLPMDIVSRSVSPLVYGSKKELYMMLCTSSVPLDDGKLSFSLTRETGKNCFMVGVKDLKISWYDRPEYWDWTSHLDSRLSEMAQLIMVYWLDIRGKITTHMLSPKTCYGAYLVFKLTYGHVTLDYAIAVVRRVNFEADNNAETGASIVQLYWGMATHRDDGLKEVKLGDFYSGDWDEGEVEARYMEIRPFNVQSGLIVEGIEFRPSGLKVT